MGKGAKDIGIEATPPSRECNDELCPWHGSLRVRGRIFKGVVKRKTEHTATVEWEYAHYVHKYERYERRKSRVYAHIPPCISVNVGDTVKIAECRPISKTKHFVIIEVLKRAQSRVN